MKCSWITLHVSDLEKSLQFYQGILGMNIDNELVTPDHKIVMLGNEEDAKIELLYHFNNNHRDVKETHSSFSIGITTNDLDNLIKKLQDNGYKPRGPITPTPHITFYFVEDPDGFIIQLFKEC